MSYTHKSKNRYYNCPMDNPQSRNHTVYKRRVNRFAVLAVTCLSLFYAVQVHGAETVVLYLCAAVLLTALIGLGFFLLGALLWETYKWAIGNDY